MTIQVRTQAELDKALKKNSGELIACVGDGWFVAWESAHVEARESAHVVARESAHVVASPYVAVQRHGTTAVVRGGVLIEIPRIDSAETWLDYAGIKPKCGLVTLYKAVDDEYRSGYIMPGGTRMAYVPGTKPEATDFDPAPRDCGAGLHGCASPACAKPYFQHATRYVAVPVKVSDLGAPDPDGDLGKIRFRCAARPVYEVDEDGAKL